MKTVAAILINNEKKFLFHLRDNRLSIPYPNYWALLGGHVEEGETTLDAFKREVLEEIEYEIKNPLFIGTFDDLVGNTVYVFKSRIDKKINELVLNEGQKLKYFSLEEIKKIKTPKVLRDFLIKNKNKF